ncbi:MAG: hypothetical protein KC635_18870 [Myxococcales bacterium]|nr:hypothetical protein [Myxococcales bacterium]
MFCLRLSAPARALALATLLAACGDSSSTSSGTPDSVVTTADTTDVSGAADVATADTSGTNPDTAVADPDTAVADADTAVVVADTDTTSPDVTEPVQTATVTIDGAATAAIPSVRRGYVQTQAVSRSGYAPFRELVPMACEGASGLLDGGRIINPTSVTIAGNFGSTCDPSGTGASFAIAEENMLYAVRQSCGGHTGSCSHDFSQAFLDRFGACAYSDVVIDVGYNCEALMPGPGVIVEVPTSLGALRVDSLDGLGEMGCAQRGATFRLDGAIVTADTEAPCTLTIDDRTPSRVAGHLEATLDVGGAARVVRVDFESDPTENRAAIFLWFSNDLCYASTFTASVRADGDDTVDVFVSGPITCQVDPQHQIAPITVTIRRPRAGEAEGRDSHELRTTLSQDGHPAWGYDRFFAIDDTPTRTRLAAYNARACSDTSLASCGETFPIVYFQTNK